MLRLRPDRFIAGGETLARDDDGRVVFVRGALPGEQAEVEVVEEKSDWARGVAAVIESPSDVRVEPPCVRRREGCGGCDWQHLAVSAQLPAKVEILADALRRTGKLTDPVINVGAAVNDRGYRTTLRVVGDAEGRAAFRMERSHDTVEADGCLIAHPAIAAILGDLRMTPELEVTVRVSVATGEMTARWDRAEGDVVGLPETASIGPSAALHEDVAGHRFRVSAASFFQSGPNAAELLVDAVRRAAPELVDARLVVDAYAGVGLFAVAAVPERAEVITIESSKAAAADSRFNLEGRTARIDRGEVGAWRLDSDRAVDVVIADPARSGLGRPGVAALSACEPGALVLVSCDPVALARDVALLARNGYRHDGTEVLDLFPHTHHVEAVTRFVPVAPTTVPH